jgi:hypothetical protein
MLPGMRVRLVEQVVGELGLLDDRAQHGLGVCDLTSGCGHRKRLGQILFFLLFFFVSFSSRPFVDFFQPTRRRT